MQVGLNVLQVMVSVFLMAVILLQNRGSGIGGAFGPQTGVFRTRRGLEQILYRMTVALSVVFLVVSMLSVRFHPPI